MTIIEEKNKLNIMTDFNDIIFQNACFPILILDISYGKGIVIYNKDLILLLSYTKEFDFIYQKYECYFYMI